MRKKIIIIIIYVLIFSSISLGLTYSNYTNKIYNYEIIIPDSWTKEELTLSNKHFMYASKDANTEIKVRAFKSSDEDIEKTIHTKTWDLRKIDPGLHKIIETEKITIKKNVTGKLLIFEYRSQKNKFLQRALITLNNGIIYIIECRSPQDIFYKYDDIFTTALASFKYISGETQNLAEPKEDIKESEELEEEPIAQIGEDEEI